MWLILTLVSSLTLAATRILQKVVLKDEKSNPFAFSFVTQILVSAAFLVYTLITNSFEVPDLSGILVNFLLMVTFYGVANILIFLAFKKAQASEVIIILAASTVFSVLAAMVMLNETITTGNVVGILLVLAGIVVINFQRNKVKLSQGHLYALLGAALVGIAFTNDAFILNHYQGIASYMVPAFGLPGLATLLLKPESVKSIPYFFTKATFPKVLVASVLYFLSALTIFTAYKSGGPISLIAPVFQTSIVFAVIFGYLFLKERDQMVKKVAGMVLAFLGVLLLV